MKIKTMFESLDVAFSMYSAIPMPQVMWNEQNMKYMLGFFPLIGLVQAALLIGWVYLAQALSVGTVLFAAVAALIPLFVTGGIHLDGFCDTVDALASHQTREKKLEILKDPHTGAFAVMGCMAYLLLTFALWTQPQGEFCLLAAKEMAVGYVFSRAMSAAAVVTFPCAKNSGLAHSFSSAARELGYSQSAVSAQISQLETELGTPLFDRVGKTVRLTDAGQTFQSYARTLLITAQQAKAALLPARAVSGTLRVALADSVCSTFLPDLLQQFHALCPQVELVLRTATADEMLRLLSANQIDLAYTLDQPLLLPSLTLAVNVPEPVCFVAPTGHPLADKAEVPLDVLAQQEFLLTERGMSYRDALDQRLAARGLSIHPYIELGSASLLCQMVERGMGFSFLPEYIVRPVLSAGRIARLHVPDCTVTMHRQLFYHKDKWLTPQMKAFIELVNQ